MKSLILFRFYCSCSQVEGEDWGNCFFSNTDLSTQLLWQMQSDKYGRPWLGIVIDPLRALHKEKPEIKAFRAFPPEYIPPTEFWTPDGTTEKTKSACEKKWCVSLLYNAIVSYANYSPFLFVRLIDRSTVSN